MDNPAAVSTESDSDKEDTDNLVEELDVEDQPQESRFFKVVDPYVPDETGKNGAVLQKAILLCTILDSLALIAEELSLGKVGIITPVVLFIAILGSMFFSMKRGKLWATFYAVLAGGVTVYLVSKTVYEVAEYFTATEPSVSLPWIIVGAVFVLADVAIKLKTVFTLII